MSGFRQHHCGAQLGSGEIGEGKMNYDDVSGCKCAHAACSSARFQSSAIAASLNSAVSCTVGASSRIVIRARRGDNTCTGSTNLTSPLSSMTASTVFILGETVAPLRTCAKGNLPRSTDGVFRCSCVLIHADSLQPHGKHWSLSREVYQGLPLRVQQAKLDRR